MPPKRPMRARVGASGDPRGARGGAPAHARAAPRDARACVRATRCSTNGSTGRAPISALLTTDLPTGPYPVRRHPVVLDARSAATRSSPRCRCCGCEPSLARGVLRFLAAHQAREDLGVPRRRARQDHARDAQGRDGGARRGAVRPLLRRRRHHAAVRGAGRRLCGAHRRPGADRRAVAGAAARRCSWIERTCDAQRATACSTTRAARAAGLANQGWKDSQDSVFHADGRIPRRADRAGRGAGLRLRRLRGDGAARRARAATTDAARRWRGARRAHARARSRRRSGCEELGLLRHRPRRRRRSCAACAPPTPGTCCSSACRRRERGEAVDAAAARRRLRHRLGHAHAGARARRASTRCPTTTARSGRTTRRSARAGMARYGERERRGASARRAVRGGGAFRHAPAGAVLRLRAAAPASRRSPIRSPACRRPGRRARCS